MQIGTSENGLKTTPLPLKFSSIMISSGTLDGTDLSRFEATLVSSYYSSFLLCDAFELAVVYFYASRYMAPENQVNIANFWIPTFTFLMAFIPGMYSIFNLTRNWIKKKHEMKRKARELKVSKKSEQLMAVVSLLFRIDSVKLRKMESI